MAAKAETPPPSEWKAYRVEYTFESGGTLYVRAPSPEAAEEYVQRGADMGLLPEESDCDDFSITTPYVAEPPEGREVHDWTPAHPPGKALGCYGCPGEFASVDELEAHQKATGHSEPE